jgi:conjugal transfer ATP-binding protein TraC
MKSYIHKTINSILGDSGFISRDVNLEDYISISEILPYRSYDEDTGIYYNKASYGFILESTPLVGASEQTVNLLTGMITDGMPKNSTLQFINWASPNVQHIFDKWAEPRSNTGGMYEKLAKARLKSLENCTWNSYSKQIPIVMRDFRLFTIVSIPSSNSNLQNKENIKALLSLKKSLTITLKSMGIHTLTMVPDSFLSLLDELVNPTTKTSYPRSKKWQKLDLLNNQIGNPEVKISVKPTGISFNNNGDEIEARSFSVRSFPEVWAQWEMSELIGDFMSDFLRMPSPFLTTFTFTVPDEASENYRANLKAARSTQQAGTDLARYMPDIRKKERDWKFVVDKLKMGQKLVKSFYQIIVYAPKDKIDEAEQSIRSIYKSNGWMLASERYMHFQSWFACLPFTLSEGIFNDLNRMGRTKTMVTWSCANLSPLQGEWKGLDTPGMLLFGRRGQPLFWNPFDNKEGNYNVRVVGKSGSGKSMFMQELVNSIVGGCGGRVIVIDDGKSFMNSCKIFGGQFAEFSQNSGLCINPFGLINKDAFARDAEYRKEVMSLIKKIVARMCKPDEKTSSIENSYIEQAIIAVWEKDENKGTITKVSNHLKEQTDIRAQDLGTMLFPFTKDGLYASYFEGESTITMDNNFMVFELELIKSHKDLLNIVMMLLMFIATEAMYKGDRKQMIALVIDEAFSLLDDKEGDFSLDIVRRTRKYVCSLISGTQMVGDYFGNEGAKAVWENSDWIVMLAQLEESIESIVEHKRLVLDDNALEALKSVKMVEHEYSELFIKGPSGYSVARLILDPFSISLYSTKGADASRINALLDKGYSLESAVGESSKQIRRVA